MCMAGFVVGQGAVTVIDIHGFLGRKSSYWTEATIRSHKVTKPLIWIGMILAVVGASVLYRNLPLEGTVLLQACIAVVLVLNGCFLSFYISPKLLQRERAGLSRELLPMSMQIPITVSFAVSFAGWWSALFLLSMYVTQ